MNVTVNAETLSRRGNTIIRIDWLQPQNFDQFDIDRYDITVTSTSGVQNMTLACGQCTSAVITVSDNVRMNTTFSINIAAVSQCGENGPTATASYTLSKLPLPNQKECQLSIIMKCLHIPMADHARIRVPLRDEDNKERVHHRNSMHTLQ